jgi:hypothetical protein
MLRFAPLLLPLALANCGAIFASIEASQRIDEAERLEALIASTDESTLTAVPDLDLRTGTARYNGQAAMEVPLGNNTLILSAIARIDADFDSDTVTADFSDWLGYNDGDTLAGYADGDVVFSDGVIGSVDSPSDISGTVSGELEYDGDTYTVDGVIDGQFATNGSTEGVGGVTLDDQTTITVNGEVVEGAQFGFAGEIAN